MAPAVDLDAPFEEDILLEVRSSRMKTMPGLTILSGIDKTICNDAVPVGFLGIEGDEHDPVFHGGRDKAIHGCESPAPLRSLRNPTSSQFNAELREQRRC